MSKTWYVEARVGSNNYRGELVHFIDDRRQTAKEGEQLYINRPVEEVIQELMDELAATRSAAGPDEGQDSAQVSGVLKAAQELFDIGDEWADALYETMRAFSLHIKWARAWEELRRALEDPSEFASPSFPAAGPDAQMQPDPFPITNPCSTCGEKDGHVPWCPERDDEPDAAPAVGDVGAVVEAARYYVVDKSYEDERGYSAVVLCDGIDGNVADVYGATPDEALRMARKISSALNGTRATLDPILVATSQAATKESEK